MGGGLPTAGDELDTELARKGKKNPGDQAGA